MQPDLLRVIVGSQRQEGCLGEVVAQVGIKPTIQELKNAVVGVSSEIFGTLSLETAIGWSRQNVH